MLPGDQYPDYPWPINESNQEFIRDTRLDTYIKHIDKLSKDYDNRDNKEDKKK